MLHGVILTYKNSTKEYLQLPVSKDVKKTLKSFLENGKVVSINCCCNSEIFYGISADLKLYPLKPNQKHAYNCKLQPESHKIHKKYNTGFFLEETNESEKLIVNMDFSFENFKSSTIS